jgi:UDP-N-acetylmuramoylalanine--D-glutamate ligase
LRRSAAALGLDVCSELDAALPFLRCRAIAAVTGSKGKSSLVKLLADALTLGGRTAVPCGNYGTALAEVALREPPPDVAVVECSSFQLETTRNLRPDVGVFLNLSPDHLARHGGMEGYRDAKLRLFQAQTPADTALLPYTSVGRTLWERYRALGLRGRAATFGAEPDADWRWVPGSVHGPGGVRLDIAGSYFDNAVLGPAAAAGAAACLLSGLDAETTAAALRAFVPLPHRMQCVRTLAGVRYVDDSKATSLTALLAGVRMAGGPVRLIAGGRLKENELKIGKELVTAGVQKGYLIGECAEKLSAAWSGDFPVEICGTLDVAVAKAAAESRRGETVLLSPGTASFDQFRSFEERGNRFTHIVHLL